MRLSTTIISSSVPYTSPSGRGGIEAIVLSPLMPHHPDGDHGDDDGDELQQHAQPHQVLRAVGRAALHHVDETEQKDQRHGADRHGKQNRTEKRGHRRYITPRCPVRYTVRNNATIWLLVQ